MAGKAVAALLFGLPAALACVAESSIPSPSETISSPEPIEVAAGEEFDGKGARYDRADYTCSGQNEGGQSDTVFVLREGATLKNVVIGKNQGEGVYCLGGGCTIENVWFEEVCEDAISIKEDAAGAVTRIIGGGAFHASDKVIQHNGCGKVEIYNFYAEDYGKVYRACGTCEQCRRDVYVEGVSAYDGGEVVGINSHTGDVAELKNVCTDAKTPCQLYDGPGEKAGAC
ncbi:putative pectate lyase F [Paramyrothecium foliicola]|nr:putative pectate lyase F [Paramyrothecium foliicola]